MPKSTGIRFALRAFALLITSAALPASLAAAQETPLPPIPESPIAQFRSWLSLAGSERDLALADKTEAMREILLGKLAEYDAMDPNERELRLRATELQYYLRPLLRLPSARRDERLPHVPADLRPLITVRLAQWDAIDPDTRGELLENGWAIRYFLRIEHGTAAEQAALRSALPIERRAQFETELARWKELPQQQRTEITRAFHGFFELPPSKQQHALDNLPEAERRQIEATLQAFAQLAPAQRQLCIDSFRKFASFTPGERADFLRNADRWKEMSPGDRAVWRRLVTQLPPLPAGLASHPMPPSPGLLSPSTPPSPLGVTNDHR